MLCRHHQGSHPSRETSWAMTWWKGRIAVCACMARTEVAWQVGVTRGRGRRGLGFDQPSRSRRGPGGQWSTKPAPRSRQKVRDIWPGVPALAASRQLVRQGFKLSDLLLAWRAGGPRTGARCGAEAAWDGHCHTAGRPHAARLAIGLVEPRQRQGHTCMAVPANASTCHTGQDSSFRLARRRDAALGARRRPVDGPSERLATPNRATMREGRGRNEPRASSPEMGKKKKKPPEENDIVQGSKNVNRGREADGCWPLGTPRRPVSTQPSGHRCGRFLRGEEQRQSKQGEGNEASRGRRQDRL